MRLQDKVILVTGAASGMGRVATKMFVEQGAKVITADIQSDPLEEAVAEVGDSHRSSILPVVGNVTESDDVKRWIEQGVKQFGKRNCIVANVVTRRIALDIENNILNHDRLQSTVITVCCRTRRTRLTHVKSRSFPLPKGSARSC